MCVPVSHFKHIVVTCVVGLIFTLFLRRDFFFFENFPEEEFHLLSYMTSEKYFH